MLKNQNQIRIGERRVVFLVPNNTETPAGTENKDIKEPIKSVSAMVDDLQKEFGDKLDEKDKETLQDYKKKAEKIYFSATEKEKFLGELEESKESAQIVAAIKNEIDNEKFESGMDASTGDKDKKTVDYRGSDSDNEERDINKTRDIIENAWATNTKELSPKEKQDLQAKVLEQVAIAHSDSDLLESLDGKNKKSIFENIDRKGILGDKMITKEEAEEIKKLIEAETRQEKTEKNEKTKKTPETKDNWQTQLDSSEAQLEKDFEKPEWYKKYIKNGKADDLAGLTPIMEVDKKIKKEIEKGGSDEFLSNLKKIGVETTKDDLANELGIVLSAKYQVDKTLFKSDTKSFSKSTQKKGESILKFIIGKYGDQASEVAQEFFVLKLGNDYKSEEKPMLRLLLEYAAFGDVEKDKVALEKYIEAKNGLETDKEKKIETNEKVTAKKSNEEMKKELKKNEQGDKSLAQFTEAKKLFGEATKLWSSGDKWEAIKTFFSALFSGLKGALYYVAGKGNNLLGDTSGMEGIPIIGPMIAKAKEYTSKAGDTVENMDNPKTIQAIGSLFSIDSTSETAANEIKKVKADLKKITVDNLLNVAGAGKEGGDPMEKFKTNNKLTLSAAQLRQLQTKLKAKNIETDKDQKIFNYLAKKIDTGDNPNYLA